MKGLKVYSGLTLNEGEVRERLSSAIFSGPIKRRDLVNDIVSGVKVVVIIDGSFHQSLAVSCNEILDAIRAGIVVYGASSLGAIRASELWRHGMRGVGRVFSYLQTHPYFRDDFLGQSFSPDTGKVLSRALIDLQLNLEHLEFSGAVSTEEARCVLDTCQSLHYSERCLADVLQVIDSERGGDLRLKQVAEDAFQMDSQKKRDAIEALERCRLDLEAVAELNGRLDVFTRSEAIASESPYFGRRVTSPALTTG